MLGWLGGRVVVSHAVVHVEQYGINLCILLCVFRSFRSLPQIVLSCIAHHYSHLVILGCVGLYVLLLLFPGKGVCHHELHPLCLPVVLFCVILYGDHLRILQGLCHPLVIGRLGDRIFLAVFRTG